MSNDDQQPAHKTAHKTTTSSTQQPVSRTSLIPNFTPSFQEDSYSESQNHESHTQLNWLDLCAQDEVEEVGIYPYEVTRDGHPYPLILIRTEGGLSALHDECPHRRIAISEMGYLEGEVVRCGWHHWGFHVESGEHIIPTGVCVDRFEVREEAGRVLVALPWY